MNQETDLEISAAPDAAKDDGRRKRMILLLALLAGIFLVLLTLLIVRLTQRREPEPLTYESEVTAMLGQLENKTEEEIQAELNRVIGEGMFHIAINYDPVFYDGETEGNLEIENVPNNHYLMRVEITLEDTGELVYSTKYIEPNKHIQRGRLSVPLEKGDYFATAMFYAYSTDTLTEMGSVATKVTLHILN